MPHDLNFQVQFDLFVKDSYSEIGTSKASMNRTGKTNAAKGVHNFYNEYKEFSDRETEAHICAAFMQMSGMTRVNGTSIQFLFLNEMVYRLILITWSMGNTLTLLNLINCLQEVLCAIVLNLFLE